MTCKMSPRKAFHAIKPEGSTASTVFSLGLSGSRGHADEARGQTRLKPGLSQGQVTTATPVRLDFRRTKILDEGCAGAMPTDSPCSVARDTASDQGCAATGSAMPSGSAFNMGCFGVVHDKLGRSIDGSLFATAPFSGNSIMSRFLCGKHGPRSEMVTRKRVGKSQAVCSPKCGYAAATRLLCTQKKRPRGAFHIGRQSRVSKLLLRSRLCLLGGGRRFRSSLCLGRCRCCNSRSNLQCSALITQGVDFSSDLVFTLGQLGDVCR